MEMLATVVLVIIGFYIFFMSKSARKKTPPLSFAEQPESTVIPVVSVKSEMPTFQSRQTVQPREPVKPVSPAVLPTGLPSDLSPTKPPLSLAFVDVETTGLDDVTDRIIEISVFIINSGKREHDGLSTLINPERPLTPFITQLTGITDEMLVNEKAEACLHKHFDFIGDRTVVAYNAKFDMGFLKAAACRLGRSFNNPSQCAMELVYERHPNLRSYKLQDVCQAFNINVDGSAHRAEYDVRCAILLFSAINKGAQPNESAIRWIDSEDYGVYVHYRKDGTPFYVWTAKDGRSTIPDSDTFWSFYVEKKLSNEYEIRCIRGGLYLSEAISMKSDFMAKHAKTVLNGSNYARKAIQENVNCRDSLIKSSEVLQAQAKLIETSDPDSAVEMYMKALPAIQEYPTIIVEEGLYGEVVAEFNAKSRSYSADALKIIDRLSLLLCRQGKPDKADAIVNSFFERYDKRESSSIDAILRRIEKAKSKASRSTVTNASGA